MFDLAHGGGTEAFPHRMQRCCNCQLHNRKGTAITAVPASSSTVVEGMPGVRMFSTVNPL
jgi:hypothetical protein